MSSVVTRSFKPAKDAGFIYATCSKSIYYGNTHWDESLKERDLWFKSFHNYLTKELITAEIRIACMEDDPFTILGYCITNHEMLQFIYVKQMFRKHGIARLLFKYCQPKGFNPDNMTDIGLSIITKHPNLFKKDLKNEETKNEDNDIRTNQATQVLAQGPVDL